jgi:tryptophanyl-tRNA synthetase
MSKSYGNFISLRELPDDVDAKVRKMPTDPARVRRTDPGNPDVCPVWQLHDVYSDEADQTVGAAGLPVGGHRLHRVQKAGD